jgi:hypothetical protein
MVALKAARRAVLWVEMTAELWAALTIVPMVAQSVEQTVGLRVTQWAATTAARLADESVA